VLIYCIRIVDKDLSSGGTQVKKGLSLPGIGLPGKGGGGPSGPGGAPGGGGPGGPGGGGPGGPGSAPPKSKFGGGQSADRQNGKKNMQDLTSEPAVRSSKFRRRPLCWMSLPRFRMSCAASTAWGTRPKRMPSPVTGASRSR